MTVTAKKATFLASLGAGLEYYDFVIYGMMAGQLSTLFFPGEDSFIALLKTFAVFAVGYLARPFGGIVFGMIGDTFGRKKTFSRVMLLMALSTFCIGLLPTHGQIGMLAAILLVFLRILQGLSFGAELPGAITVVCEYAEKAKRGAHSAFVISSVSLGSMTASLVLYGLTSTISKDQIAEWGWRIPFLLGGILAIANYFIRRDLLETPEFTQLKKDSNTVLSIKKPLSLLLKGYKVELMLGIGLTFFMSSLVIFSLYLPTYLSQHYGFPTHQVYSAITWGLLWAAVFMPFSGLIADRVGKSALFIGASLGFILIGTGLFSLLNLKEYSYLVLFMVLYQTILAFLTASYFPLLAGIFPTQVRYTGLAACYNIAYSLMATLPMIVTGLIFWTNSSASALWFLMGIAATSAGSCYLLAKRSMKALAFQKND